MSRGQILVFLAVAFVIIGLATFYFQWDRIFAIDLKKEVLQLQERTAPPGSSTPSSARFTEDTYAIRAEWAFATGSSQQEYFNWLTQHVPTGYTAIQNSPSEMVLRKQLPGDSCILQLDADNESSAQISAKFIAGPD